MRIINTSCSESGTRTFHLVRNSNGGKRSPRCTTITVLTMVPPTWDSSLGMISLKSCGHSHSRVQPCFSCQSKYLNDGGSIITPGHFQSLVQIQRASNGNSTYLDLSDFPFGPVFATVPVELVNHYVDAKLIPGCIYAMPGRSFNHPSCQSLIPKPGKSRS